MRPVRRGLSPIYGEYVDYKKAKTDLISRISSGSIDGEHKVAYCSYCERVINTNLAVEHIQPKGGTYGRPDLEGCWENFLLACVNCNSVKRDRGVFFDFVLFPDRDNTFNAFVYTDDGRIKINSNLSQNTQDMAKETLWLTGLDKDRRNTLDINKRLISQDRVNQRKQAWGIASNSLNIYLKKQADTDDDIKNLIVENMVLNGYFSVWMTVFKNHPEMTTRFIDSISGTRGSGCFDGVDNASMSHSNLDGLPKSRLMSELDKI